MKTPTANKPPGDSVAGLQSLPLFADDDVIGVALLGAQRGKEWRALAPLLEARGLPKVDPLMGGRYIPAVRAYFDHEYGIDRIASPPLSPDGMESLGTWKRSQKRRA